MNPVFYTGRKKKTTVNVVAVCDAHGRFNFVSVNWPGPVHDSRSFSKTVLYKSFCRGWRPFKGAFVIADKGYKNEDFIVAIKKAKKGRKQFYK
uniref:DDE Tnp4 domain-containing protein n=1 Tax=Panagrolaimus davidi TaxID=227884 RepID=A0A914PAN4_9BILA